MLIESLEQRQLFSSYFVDADGGFDTNDGLSPSTPFRTIDRVNALNLLPGDAVSFAGGDTFDGTLRFDDADAGSAAFPVVVGSYGTGRATINARNAAGVLAVNTSGLAITNLNVVGSGQSPATFSGIEFRNTLPGNVKLHYVRINDVDVSGFGDYGIEVTGTADKSGFKDVRIENVSVHHNTHGGIASTGRWDNTSAEYAHEDVYVGRADVFQNPGYANAPNHSGSGIVLADVRRVTIERSVASYNGAANTHVGGPVGIWVWDVDQAVIRHNESHHNQTNSTADGGGFDFDGGVTNSVMEYNYSHDNAGAGYGIYQFQGARAFHNNHVRYNLSVNDARKNGYGAIDFWNGNGSNGIKDTHVYNNTVYLTKPTSGTPKALRFISGTVNVTVFNNVFQTTGGLQLAEVQAKQNNLRMNGNDWWSSGSAFSLKVFAKTYKTFGAYVSGTGHDAQGRNLDPKMVDPTYVPTVGIANIGRLETSLDNFKLGAGSELGQSQYAGLNLASVYSTQYRQHAFVSHPTTDFYGNALAGDDGLYTIGAYDFV